MTNVRDDSAPAARMSWIAVRDQLFALVAQARQPAMAIFLGVFAVCLVARVRPWDAGAYMTGDLMPSWPTRGAFLGDVGLWTDQDGGSPSGYGGSIFTWSFRWIAVVVGIGDVWLDGLGYSLPPAIAAAGVVLLVRVLGVAGPGVALAACHYAFALEWVQNSADAAQWSRALAPWLGWGVVMVNRAASESRGARAAFGFAVLAVVFGSAGSVNLPQVIVVAVVVLVWLAVFTAWDLVSGTDRSARLGRWARAWGTCIAFGVPLGGWLIVWNAFIWLFPILGVGSGSVATPTGVDAWSWTHGNASFGNLFVGLGYWGWSDQYFGMPFRLANSVPGRLLVSVPFAIALLAQFVLPATRSRLATLSLLMLLFVMKGVHEPFGYINRALHENVPGMQLLREPLGKLGFGWLLLNAVLLAVAFDRRGGTPSAGISWRRVGLWVAWASVAFTGFLGVREVKDTQTSLMAHRWVVVPPDWHDARAFIAEKRTNDWGRTLILPANDFYAVPYVWGSYATDTLSSRFLGLSQVQRVNGYFNPNPQSASATGAIYDALGSVVVFCDDILRAASDLGVASALIRYDIGSRSARPLGSGPPQTEGPTRASSVLATCGWRQVHRNATLELLVAPAGGALPPGTTGSRVEVGVGKPSSSPDASSPAPVRPNGPHAPPSATTLPSGYGFALLDCGRDGECGALSVARAWLAGTFEWCEPVEAGGWCTFSTVALAGGAHVVRNAWEDAYYVLLAVAGMTLVVGGAWAIAPWVVAGAPVTTLAGQQLWSRRRAAGP